MLARDLARPFATVDLDTRALEAARLLAENRLPGLIVVDESGRPYTILAGSQVLGFVVPRYVQEDPALARAYDEKSADALCAKLDAKTVRDLLPPRDDRLELPWAEPDETAIEIAVRMQGLRIPIVAVVEDDRLLGAVTVSVLLGHLLGGAQA